MKHQALARVFAVVLAIMCLLMLLNGATGFGKAAKAHEERTAFEEKYAQRIENYVTLHEQVENSISYDEAYELLKEKLEQHDKDAAQHRTDTALYTAEKGGNTMGANLIWEAMPEIAAAKQELAKAKKQFEDVQTAYNGVKGDLQDIAAQAQSDADESGMDAAQMQQLAQEFAALLNAEPRLPEGFFIPEDPGEPPQKPTEPQLSKPTAPAFDRPTAPEEPPQDADAETLAAYQEQVKAYEDALAEWAEYDTATEEYDAAMAAYQQKLAAYESYPERKRAYDEALYQQQEYEEQHAAWESQVNEAVAQLPIEHYLDKLEILGGDLQTLMERAQPLIRTFNELSSSMGGAEMPGVDMSALQTLSQYANMDPSTMTEEQALAAAQEIAGALSSMAGAFGSVDGGIQSVDGLVAEAAAKLSAAEAMLAKAESEMKGQLENIWYHLGQLEEKADELREEKERLDLEALGLDKELVETDQLKILKNRHISARQLLINVPEVKSGFAGTGDLEASARAYLEDYRLESQRQYQGLRLINLLAVLGGVFGILGIPGAYEKLRGRFWLIAPVVLCLGCALAADAVNMRLGLGQMYTALFTAIFAAVHLLIILPKKKAIPTE